MSYRPRTPSDPRTSFTNVPRTTSPIRLSLPQRILLNTQRYHPHIESRNPDTPTAPTSPANNTFSRIRSNTNLYNTSMYTKPSFSLYPLYQSSTSTIHHDGIIDARVITPKTPISPNSPSELKIHTKKVSFAKKHTMNAYTPSPYFSLSTPSFASSINTPSVSSNASSSSMHSISTIPKLRANNPSNQSSTSFKRVSSISTSSASISDITIARRLKPCPNLVSNKCRCKEILAQNNIAHNIWCGCYRLRINNKKYLMDNREIEVSYFDGLYAKLCEYLQYSIDSDRVPSKSDISNVIESFGGFQMENGEIVIDRCHFLSFWKWFRGSCSILKDVYNLWDTKFPFQLNLFMNRRQCEEILSSASHGTFLVRLSSSNQNGLVVSYTEPVSNENKKIRHILLIRKSSDNYIAKTNRNSLRTSRLNKLIRAFVKLQFVYTPRCIYKKNHVF